MIDGSTNRPVVTSWSRICSYITNITPRDGLPQHQDASITHDEAGDPNHLFGTRRSFSRACWLFSRALPSLHNHELDRVRDPGDACADSRVHVPIQVRPIGNANKVVLRTQQQAKPTLLRASLYSAVEQAAPDSILGIRYRQPL